jgi:hypothetical protein
MLAEQIFEKSIATRFVFKEGSKSQNIKRASPVVLECGALSKPPLYVSGLMATFDDLPWLMY